MKRLYGLDECVLGNSCPDLTGTFSLNNCYSISPPSFTQLNQACDGGTVSYQITPPTGTSPAMTYWIIRTDYPPTNPLQLVAGPQTGGGTITIPQAYSDVEYKLVYQVGASCGNMEIDLTVTPLDYSLIPALDDFDLCIDGDRSLDLPPFPDGAAYWTGSGVYTDGVSYTFEPASLFSGGGLPAHTSLQQIELTLMVCGQVQDHVTASLHACDINLEMDCEGKNLLRVTQIIDSDVTNLDDIKWVNNSLSGIGSGPDLDPTTISLGGEIGVQFTAYGNTIVRTLLFRNALTPNSSFTGLYDYQHSRFGAFTRYIDGVSYSNKTLFIYGSEVRQIDPAQLPLARPGSASFTDCHLSFKNDLFNDAAGTKPYPNYRIGAEGSFSATRSTFDTDCKTMWGGILATDWGFNLTSGVAYMDRCTVRSSFYGIGFEKTGSTFGQQHFSSVQIDRCQFINNYRGVELQDKACTVTRSSFLGPDAAAGIGPLLPWTAGAVCPFTNCEDAVPLYAVRTRLLPNVPEPEMNQFKDNTIRHHLIGLWRENGDDPVVRRVENSTFYACGIAGIYNRHSDPARSAATKFELRGTWSIHVPKEGFSDQANYHLGTDILEYPDDLGPTGILFNVPTMTLSLSPGQIQGLALHQSNGILAQGGAVSLEGVDASNRVELSNLSYGIRLGMTGFSNSSAGITADHTSIDEIKNDACILFGPSQSADITNAYIGHAERGLTLQGTTTQAVVANSTFDNVRYGIQATANGTGADLDVSQTQFTQNNFAIAISKPSSKLTTSCNVFSKNTVGIYTDAANTDLRNTRMNDFSDYDPAITSYGIYLNTGASLAGTTPVIMGRPGNPSTSTPDLPCGNLFPRDATFYDPGPYTGTCSVFNGQSPSTSLTWDVNNCSVDGYSDPLSATGTPVFEALHKELQSPVTYLAYQNETIGHVTFNHTPSDFTRQRAPEIFVLNDGSETCPIAGFGACVVWPCNPINQWFPTRVAPKPPKPALLVVPNPASGTSIKVQGDFKNGDIIEILDAKRGSRSRVVVTTSCSSQVLSIESLGTGCFHIRHVSGLSTEGASFIVL